MSPALATRLLNLGEMLARRRRQDPPGSAGELASQWLISHTLTPQERQRLEQLQVKDEGHGFDVFGLSKEHLPLSLATVMPLYQSYFRVHSTGTQKVPSTGPCILAGNHSGLLPVDAMMLWTDVVLKAGRVPRVVADHLVPALPVLGTFFARSGMVGGSRGNLVALLKAGELLVVFPEGTPGIGKGFSKRYQLQHWRVGHAELAIRYQAPVVPVGIIGAEEAWIQVAKLRRLGQLFGWPHIPVPLTPLPLPARFHLIYGDPLELHRGLSPDDADDPQTVHAAALKVRAQVERLIAQGLQERAGVFR